MITNSSMPKLICRSASSILTYINTGVTRQATLPSCELVQFHARSQFTRFFSNTAVGKASGRNQRRSHDSGHTSMDTTNGPISGGRKHPFPPELMNFYITCHPGLKKFLSQELEQLGMNHVMKGHGAVLSNLSSEDMRRCCLYLGTASQILIRCGNAFPARGLAELKRIVQKMPWGGVLDKGVQLNTKVISSKSKLYHTGAVKERIEEAIYNVLGQNEIGSKGPVVSVHANIFRDQVQLSIASAMSPLHRRGYRLQTGKAPLREDLAYAFLWSAGLRPSYFKQLLMPAGIIDPFCGSGTIAIEAASMIHGLPPGRLRDSPFQGTFLSKPKAWQQMLSNRSLDNKVQMASLVYASDRDAGVIDAAISNAQRAGVAEMIEFQNCAFSSSPWLHDSAQAPDSVLLASNLPFGRRIASTQRKGGNGKYDTRSHGLLPMYQKLAHHLQRLSDSEHDCVSILLTDDAGLVKRGGFAGNVSIPFQTRHGGVPVFGVSIRNNRLD